MFIAIPKSVIDDCPEKSLPAWVMCGKYILAQSKGQARRAILQADCEPDNYKIFQLRSEQCDYTDVAMRKQAHL